MDSAAHWRQTYAERASDELSWTEAVPKDSLALIAEAGVAKDAGILDVGGGASSLAGELLKREYRDITVADISGEAMRRARAQLGSDAKRVSWIEADLRGYDFGRQFDLWHDRAAFHFMVSEEDRDGYLRCMRRSLLPGGQLVLATFGPEGPTRCSGLPVRRYGAEQLARTLGADFELLAAREHQHRTPSGREQQFLYARFRRIS